MRHPRDRFPRDARRSRLRFEPLERRELLTAVSLWPVADTFTRAGVGAGSAPVLDVLDRGAAGGDYVAYLRFDVGGYAIDELQAATLTLYKQAGSRNDFVVPARFEVYGLLDLPGNTPQGWSEPTLAEGGVGAEYTTVGGDGVDVTRLFNLDQDSGADVFESVVNADGAPQSLTGPDLVAFLQARANADGLATFVVRTDAGDATRGYGFASRENPAAGLRPTLELAFPGDPQPDPYPDNPVVLPRQMERLDRGLIAMRRSSTEVYLGWRLFGDDPQDIAFNVYRSANGAAPVLLNTAPISQTTDFVDSALSVSGENTYFIRPVLGGVEQAPSKSVVVPVFAPIRQFFEVPIQPPAPVQTADGVWHSYTANDASVGDLDGDGDYEIVLKWTGEPADLFGLSANMYVDAYDLDGARLWRIDVGPNIKTIASSMQFLVYDLDGDGRAEVAMNTSDGAVSGTGQVIGDPNARWTNADGWVTTGPEYLTVFDGLSGAILVNTPLQPDRGVVTDWGDNYGHRATTHKYAIAYVDGQRPSIITGRGIYHGQAAHPQAKTEIVAWNWRDGVLTQEWTFVATEGTGADVNPEYVGQGNQAMSVADVDGDGFDEVIWGAMVVDHDGSGLYSTGRGHGDALHVADMDPDNPGLEVFEPHENPGEYQNAGGDYRDAMTGQLLVGIPATNDVGRGVAFDIDPNYRGYEFWATTNDPNGGPRQIYNVQEGPIYPTPTNMSYNFGVWWDADPLRELLDGTTIAKWRHDWATPGLQNLVWSGGAGIASTAGLASNNGTKATPALTADIFGDWREEIIWRRSDNTALQVWSTTIDASSRMATLMHDLQYREAVAWQNTYYNQPPHPSFYLGDGMAPPPSRPIFYGGELAGDYNRDSVVDAADYSVWRDSVGSVHQLAADGDHNGVVDQSDHAVWAANFGAVASPSTATAKFSATTAAAPALATDDEPGAMPAVRFAKMRESPLPATAKHRAPSAASIEGRSIDLALLLLWGDDHDSSPRPSSAEGGSGEAASVAAGATERPEEDLANSSVGATPWPLL